MDDGYMDEWAGIVQIVSGENFWRQSAAEDALPGRLEPDQLPGHA